MKTMRKIVEILGWIVFSLIILGVFSVGKFNISYTAENISHMKFQTTPNMNPIVHIKRFISQL